jgi:predicted Rossmann fold nucleotide-binding protein DprA/Smf involved in DNA uptake
MHLSLNTQAILLLTGYFNSSYSTEVKPLTVGEWARFAEFLRGQAIAPRRLLEVGALGLLDGYSDKSITMDRIDALLKRGTAMAVALEKWSRANVWVISRADQEYPERLKRKLGQNSPPILYGCGNKALLNSGGVGVVGSRDVSDEDLNYTKSIGAKAANSGISVISGGAKGVDQESMLSALESGGTVVGVLADSLLRASSSRQYRKYLVNSHLVLITPFYPEAGFNAGNAMQRNKYIYCLSDATIVVHSGNPEFGKNGKGGGTWTGAIENIKKSWVPLWVKQTTDTKAGNALIVKEGAYWLPDSVETVDLSNLFSLPDTKALPLSEDILSQLNTEGDADNTMIEGALAEKTIATATEIVEVEEEPKLTEASNKALPENFYEYFLLAVQPLLIEAKNVDELVDLLDLNKQQLNVWLKKAVEEGRIKKLNKPVRYEWINEDKKQRLLI